MTNKKKIQLVFIFVLLIFATSINASLNEPGTPDDTIVTGDGTYKPYFPSITRLPNGDLVVLYYWNTQHMPDGKGRIFFKKGILNGDNTYTWLVGKQLIDLSPYNLDSRDPHITLLSNGTLIVNFFTTKTGVSEIQDNLNDARVAKITYNGDLLTTIPEIVKTPKDNTATSGAIIELDHNGTLLIPTYGNIDGGFSRVTVSKSTDWGNTWDINEVLINVDENPQNEASLVNMGGEILYAALRPGTVLGNSSSIYQSTNNGETWYPFINQPLKMHAPDLLKIDNKRVFLTWCDNTISSKRPVFGKMLYPDKGWDYTPTRLIYTAEVFDMGYPSSVLMADNKIYTIYYNSSDGAVYGTKTDFSDWNNDEQNSIITFENESVGNTPSDFILVGSSAIVSDLQSFSGSQSLKIIDNSSSILTNAVKITNPTIAKDVEFNVFPVSAPNGICFGLSNGGNYNSNAIFHFTINSSGKLLWYNGTWNDDLTFARNIIFNQWNKVRVYAFSVNSADIYINGVYAGTAHNWHSGFSTMDRMRFMSGSTAGSGDNYYIDDLSIKEINHEILSFENDLVDQVPFGFNEIDPSALVSDQQSSSGSQSLKIIDYSSSILTNIIKPTTASLTKYLEFKIFPVSASNGICFGLSSGGNYNSNCVFHFAINNNGQLFWYDGSWNNDLTLAGNVSFNRWNVINIHAVSIYSAIIYLNGIYAGTAHNWHTGFSTIDRLRFMSGSTVGSGDYYYIDDVSPEESGLKSSKSYIEKDNDMVKKLNSNAKDPFIYPNPTNDYVFLRNNDSDILNVKVYSIDGKVLANINSMEPDIKLDLSKFKNGLYIFTVKNKYKVISYKIIKE